MINDKISMVMIAIGIFFLIIQPFSMTGAVIDISTNASRISLALSLVLIILGITSILTNPSKH